MFKSYYASTRDRKGHEHNYRLKQGEGVPAGHEITNLSVAGQFKFSEVVGEEMAGLLTEFFGSGSKRKARRAKA
jgi:hypothetical protein